MVAPTRVNEGAPQEPAPGRPGSATAGPAQVEAVTEDPAADLMEMAPAEAAPAAAVVEATPVASAEAETAEAAQAEAAQAGAVPDEAELSRADSPGPDADQDPGLDAEQDPGSDAEQEGRAREASRDVGPLAVVGIIIGVIALVGVAAGVLAMVTHGFKPKTVVSYRPAAVFGLRPGQCINSGSSSLSYTVVSCTSPHDAEVFARFSLPAAAWPGSSAVRQEVGDACASRLGGYLNPQLATIGLTQAYVYPNRDAWDADQRTVVCEVSSGNGKLTGSVRAKG